MGNADFHVIETTAAIATKFCTTIKITMYSSWVVQIGNKQIKLANGRHSKNVEKLLYLHNS